MLRLRYARDSGQYPCAVLLCLDWLAGEGQMRNCLPRQLPWRSSVAVMLEKKEEILWFVNWHSHH